MVIQGRMVSQSDICFIQELLVSYPDWNRTKLSQELCDHWQWYKAGGQRKDIACRSFLLKLERKGHIQLPARQGRTNNRIRGQKFEPIFHSTGPLEATLKSIVPIKVIPVWKSERPLYQTYLSLYHYLGYRGTVGENMRYLVYDRCQRPLGCLEFGSAAWSIASRDNYIDWDAPTRKKNLRFLTNNMRFLILPWVRVRYLASHILSKVAQRISKDWELRYGHPIYLLETFVEQARFQGTSYQAANWVKVGQTKGRSRNDRDNTMMVPVKDIYLYPLRSNFRSLLSQ